MSLRPKLTRAQRAEIVTLGKIHRETSTKALAAKYGVSVQTIHDILNGKVFVLEHRADLENRA